MPFIGFVMIVTALTALLGGLTMARFVGRTNQKVLLSTNIMLAITVALAIGCGIAFKRYRTQVSKGAYNRLSIYHEQGTENAGCEPLKGTS